MALAKYVIKDEKDIEVTLRDVRIDENEIEIIPSSWTNGNVTVSISTKKNGEVYYKINENGEWKKYEKNFEVEENCNIYAKIKYTDGASPETVKEVTNIDKIKPTVEIQDKSEYTTSNIVTKLDGTENTNNGHSTSTTTWNDISGNKKNGTITGGTWGKNYLQFDGSTWVNLGQINSNYYTLEATFSAERDNIGEEPILANWESGGAGIALANGKIRATFYIGGIYRQVVSKENIVIGEIYNAVVSYDGEKLCLYVNGILQDEFSITGTVGTPGNSTVMILGGNPTGNTTQGVLFKGKVYNALVYNQALTAEQVRNNAQNSLAQATGKYTILVGKTTTNISKKLIANDEGGSGLKTLNYAYSQSNTTEPTTYEEFKNEATVTKSATGGNWYIWTKVLDNAGNRAEETKVSPAYNVGYQISYDANGGTGAPKEQRKVHGTELKISETIPTRTGYEFQGWATTNTATTAELKAGENYTTDKAVKLYAVWKKYKYLNTTTSKYYMKLSDALNEVKDKETIKAMDYAIETTAPTLATAKAITFDLNGQTVVMSNVTLTNNGTLTIVGASGTLTGSGADTITNNGTLIKNTATEIASSATADYYVIKNNGTATISAGKLTSSYGGIYNGTSAKLNVTGGTFNTTSTTISNDSILSTEENPSIVIDGDASLTVTAGNAVSNNDKGLVCIKNGTLSMTGTGASPTILNQKSGNILVSGGTIRMAGNNAAIYNGYNSGNGDGTVEIRGGTIESTASAGIYNYEKAKLIISGGSVNSYIDGIAQYGTDASTMIEGGTITSLASNNRAGLAIRNGTVMITGGKITGGQFGIWTGPEKPNITLGINDGKVSVISPEITGGVYGIYAQEGTIFNFYDGKLTGAKGNSISGTVTSTATNCVVIKTTSGSTETAVLGPSAPVITAKLDDANGATYTGGTWTNHSVWVQLKSASIGAGIKEYQWYENGAWTTRELTTNNNVGMITYTATRNETIRFRAIDNNGVISYETVLGIKIDKIAPTAPTIEKGYGILLNCSHNTANLTISGSTYTTTSGDPMISFSGVNRYTNVTGVRVKFNKALEKNLETLQVFYSTGGAAYSEANSKKVGAPAGSTELKVDIPKGTYDNIRVDIGSVSGVSYELSDIYLITSDDIWNNGNIRLVLNSTDANSGIAKYQVKYSNSNNAWQDSSTNIDTWYVERNETVYYRAIDNAGNVSTETSITIKIDRTAPTVPTITNSSGGNWTNQNVTITLSSTDSASGLLKYQYKYSESNNQWIYSKPTDTWSGDRNETIYYRAMDNVGNVSDESSTTIKIDKTGPTVTFGTNGNTTAANTASTTVTVTDGGSGVKASSLKYLWTTTSSGIGSGDFVGNHCGTFTSGGTVSLPSGIGGDVYLWILAEDNLGNRTIKNSNKFVVSNIAPEADISVSTTAWTAGNVTMTIKPYAPTVLYDSGYIVTTNRDFYRATFPTKSYGGTKFRVSGTVKAVTTADSAVTTGAGFSYKNTSDALAWPLPQNVTTGSVTTATAYSKIYTIPTDYKESLKVFFQIGITAGTAGYKVEYTNVKYEYFDYTKIKSVTVNGTAITLTNGVGTYTATANGTYSIVVTDIYGNSRTFTQSVTNIDKTAPTAPTITNSSGGNWINQNVTITLSSTDSQSGVSKYQYKCSGTNNQWADAKSTDTWTADRSGIVYYRSIDNAGNISKESSTEIKIDKTAPTAPTITNSSGGNWTNQNVTITLSSTDSQSGVSKYQYKCSGTNNQWADAKSTDTWTAERNGTVYYRAIDNAGNISKESSTEIKIDKTAPTAPTITNSSGGNWTNQNVTITLSSTDSQSGVSKYQYKCSGTNNQWADAKSTDTWTADRSGIVYYRSIDNAGNISKESSTEIKIDKTAPVAPTIEKSYGILPNCSHSVTNLTISGSTYTTTSGDPTISFSGMNKYTNVTGVRVKFNKALEKNLETLQVFYSTGGAAYSEANSKKAGAPAGSTELKVDIPKGTYNNIRVDIGSVSGVSYELSDIYLITSDDIWNNGNIRLVLNSTDANSGIAKYQVKYSNSNNAWQDISTNIDTWYGARSETVYYRAIDNAGNASTGTSIPIKIDRTAPTVSVQDKRSYTTANIVTKLDGTENTSSGHSTSVTTWSDISGKSKNGTITGGTWGANYLQFNGTSTWVNLGVMNSNYQSLEATFSTDRDNIAEDVILCNWETGGAGIYLANGRLYASFYIGGAYKAIPSKEKCVIGEIYNAIGTYDGKKLSFYINGVLQGELSITGTIGTPANSTVMAIGANPSRDGISGTPSLFKGKIYNVAIYNQALTVEQVRNNAQDALAQATGNYTMLVGSSSANISKKITATDAGGSGLKSFSYGYSQSNTTEPTYATFTNGATVTKAATGGNWYLWNNVLDNAGNRGTPKVTSAYNVGYQVHYDANGGTGAPVDQRKAHGTSLTLSSTKPTRTGYMFQGWATSSTATTVGYTSGGSYTSNQAITLYAVWKAYAYQNTDTSKYYDTLKEAIDAATSNQVIKAITSKTETTEAVVPSGKTVYLELNGNTINTSKAIKNNGILYVNYKGSTSGTINHTGTDSAVLNASDSYTSLLIKNTTITSKGIGVETTSKAIMLSSVRITSAGDGVKISAKDQVSTIENCTVKATTAGISAVAGKIIINGSSITGDYGIFNRDGYIQIEKSSKVEGTTYAGVINWPDNAGTIHVGSKTATFSTTSEQVTGKTYGTQNAGSKSYMYLDNGRVQGLQGATNGTVTTTRSGYTTYTTTSGSYKVMYLKAASSTSASSNVATMSLGRSRAINILKEEQDSSSENSQIENEEQAEENNNQSTDENENREENVEEDTEKNKEENSSEKITEKDNNIGEYNKEQMDNAKMNAKDVDEYEKEYILLRYEENKYSNNPEELKKKMDTEDIDNKTLWTDQTENKLDAIITNANWKDKYLEFNGETTYGTLDKINTKALTIETTISCTKLPKENDECIIGDAQNNTELLYITKEGNIKTRLKIGEKEYEATSTEKLEENKVYGITLTYDGKSLIIYINGEEEVRIEIEEGKKFFDNELKLIIGAKSNGKTGIGSDTNEDDNTQTDENAMSNYFYGNMYTFSIYNEAIDEEKILNNYIYNSKLVKQK